MLFSSGY